MEFLQLGQFLWHKTTSTLLGLRKVFLKLLRVKIFVEVFWVDFLILYHLKTLKTQKFSRFFSGYKKYEHWPGIN